MRLISESTGARDLPEWFTRRANHVFGAFHARHGDVCPRTDSVAVLECAREVTFAKTDDFRNLCKGHFGCEVRVDVPDGRATPPVRETRLTHARRRRALR
jgi:hypothetical protein